MIHNAELLAGGAGAIEIVISMEATTVPSKIIIVCHPHPVYGGSMDNKVVTTIGRAALGVGFGVVRFNFRGVGQSTGVFDHGHGETADLLKVMDWVQQHYCPQTLVLSGFSFGSFVAYQAACVCSVAQLICVAPPVNHFEFSKPPPDCPWSVVMGTDDEVVPFSEVSQWVHDLGMQDSYLVITESSHFFHGKLLPLRAHITELLTCDTPQDSV